MRADISAGSGESVSNVIAVSVTHGAQMAAHASASRSDACRTFGPQSLMAMTVATDDPRGTTMSNVLSEVASFYQHAATDAAEEHRRQAP